MTVPPPRGGLLPVKFRFFPALLPLLLIASAPSGVFAGEGTITLFHTSDVHASFLPTEATWLEEKPLIGGFAALDHYLNRERESSPHSLYLDGGDFMTGNPISNIEYNGAKGGALVELFRAVGLDAMALGNHEFDHPRENTVALIRNGKFPILAANVRYTGGGLITEKGYIIREVGGVRVGIICLAPDDLSSMIQSTACEGLESMGAVEVLKKLVPEVDEKTDLIVVLSHQGIGGDRIIAQEVDGIDIIVGGHSHTRLERGEWVGDVLIAQAGGRMRYLGKIDLTVEDDRAVDVRCALIPLWVDGIKPSDEMVSLISRFETEVENDYGRVIARSTELLGRSGLMECDLGNWLSDRVRAITGADIAFLNSGGLRANLEAGDVRKLDIHEILPFNNALCTFRCTGEELRGIVESNLTAGVTGEHGVLQSSGLLVKWSRVGEVVQVREIRLGLPGEGPGILLDEGAIYTVASVDYVAISLPEKYLGYRPDNVRATGSTLTEAIMLDVQNEGIVTPPVGERMVELKRVEPDRSAIDG